MSLPTVVIVGADKGGVGKTTVTRAFLDWCAQKAIPTRVFDSESPNGMLTRFAPEATIIDIARVRDQMQVFDGASPEAVTVVDLRAGLLTPTLQALDDAKLLEEVRAGSMRLILLHVLGPTFHSMQEVIAAAKKIGDGAKHLMVKNHINATDYSDADKDAAGKILQANAHVTIHVPLLVAEAYLMVDRLGGSYAAFAHGTEPRTLLRGRVRTWLDAVWSEFDRVQLSTLVT